MGRYITVAPRVKKRQVFTVSGIFIPSPGLIAAGGVVEVRCVGGGGGGGFGPIYSQLLPNDHFSAKHIWARSTGGGGGSGADMTHSIVVTGQVEVTIGAGGINGDKTLYHDPENPTPYWRIWTTMPTAGGATSFGTLLSAAGGHPGGCDSLMSKGGQPGGEGGHWGEDGRVSSIFMSKNSEPDISYIPGRGGGRGGVFGINNGNAPPNSGGGGSGGALSGSGGVPGKGGSGICIVSWEE